jgi:excisionase family DNA binding protein
MGRGCGIGFRIAGAESSRQEIGISFRCGPANPAAHADIDRLPGLHERAILDSNQWPSAPESGGVPQQGLILPAKPRHSLTSGDAPVSRGQPRLAPFDTKRADAKRMGFSVRELAEQLHVSTATIYGWVKAGKLGHLRLGGNIILILTTAVDRFVAASPAG